MANNFVPKTWSLEDILPEPVERSLEAALNELEEKTTAFEKQRPKLTDQLDPAEFSAIFADFEAIMALAHRLGAYGQLSFSADTQNPDALNLRDRVDQVLTEISNRTLFFTLWIKGLSTERIAELTRPGDYRHFANDLLKFKPHTLSESEEQIINLKNTNGIDAMVNLYDMITNAFTFSVQENGEVKTLTRDQLSALYRHPSPDARAAAYQELFRVYSKDSAVLSQIYSHRVRDWHSESLALRKYSTPISVRNLANDVPDEIIEVLLDVCAKNNDVFQRYFKMKAGWLGMDRLRRYDIYAPLAPADKNYEYDDAVNLVMDSFRRFSPAVAEMVMSIFNENHIDAEIRHGKRGGAFCYSVAPGMTPWVLVNFSAKVRDVATLAHELGHGLHGILASGHSILTYHASLPLAETASVFAEMLLTDRLLGAESDPAVRRDLLASTLDDAYATIQRQIYFTLFEREAHKHIVSGKSIEQLCDRYLENLRDQFADSLELSDDFKWEWIVIPHIYHAPFYTYAYSFGQLLVLALYQQYRNEGESFIPRYLKLLSYGGSAEPVTILSEAGFDIRSSSFWQGGYDYLNGLLQELEAIA